MTDPDRSGTTHTYQTVQWLDEQLRRAVADEGGRVLHYLAATIGRRGGSAGRLDVVVEFLVPPADPGRLAERLQTGLRSRPDVGEPLAALRPAVHVVPAGAFHQWWAAMDEADADVTGPAGLVADPALLADLRHQSAAGWREFAG